MDRRANPFEDLYVSETIPPRDFVKLFSPFLVRHALPLFQSGNVLLRGTQGSGKSMLLSLLKPSIRLAYVEAEEKFPVPPTHRRFLAAGINLRKSGVLNLGQRPIERDPDADREQFPFYFGDFLNYWLVDDLLQTIETFATAAQGLLARELDLKTRDDSLNQFAGSLATDPCWFGALNDVRSHAALRAALRARITQYFHFLNWNAPDLPEAIRTSKTTIGVPIARAAFHLREARVVPEDVKIFVQIDQYEELGLLAQIHGDLGGRYREVINRAMGIRDQQVSYRVGSRRWAWTEMRMVGTKAVLERERDYTVVDLDELLQRPENPKTWTFPRFAEDVFRRRVLFAGFSVGRGTESTLQRVFGVRPSPTDRARMYVKPNGGCAPERVVRVEPEYSDQWRAFLLEKAANEPLTAKLAEAWARQQGGKGLREPPPQRGNKPLPWEREYWSKERREQALMQLAATCAQRMVWAGREDIIALSGGNILVFVSLCRQVWGAYIRATPETEQDRLKSQALPTIPIAVQTIGVEEASRHWYEKTPEQPGGGSRQRFVNFLGRHFRGLLLDDRAMSYPGRNGFSLMLAQLEGSPKLRDFLRDAVAYGDLVEAPHTTKEKDRSERIKWYLKPVLSPSFQIPVSHAKEPLYVHVDEVEAWRVSADKGTGKTFIHDPTEPASPPQIPLFPPP